MWGSGHKKEKLQIIMKSSNVSCVNNCAEQNICLIYDFVSSYKSEDMKENVLLVSRDNRYKKDISKSNLVVQS